MHTRGTLVQKTAVRFAKTGPAIYHSHHDMIRFWERAVKRAALPMRLSQGFNPRPRLVFPHALGLGIASSHEEVELELHSRVELQDLLDRLRQTVEPALTVLEVRNLPPVKKSRQIVASSYRMTGWGEAFHTLPGAVEKIMAGGELPVRRGAKGKERTVDIRPYLESIEMDPARNDLTLRVTHTPAGSARPDEVLALLAGASGVDSATIEVEKTGMMLV